MTPLLQVDGLYKRFSIAGGRVVKAVNGISFSLSAGETLGLVGESGSGKTTVGRCILGLETISEGRILLDGLNLARAGRKDLARIRGKVQIVFQESAEALDPRMRVGNTIEEPLIALGVGTAERARRVGDVLEMVGLTRQLLAVYPAELSAGLQQRIGIARAMITEPKLLVLDEPTSALDPTARADIIELLQRIQEKSGIAYLFISHDLSTVRFLSHRVAVMYLGMIVEDGPAAEVFARPRHPYTVGLLSSVLLPNPRLRWVSRVTLSGEIPSPIDLPSGCFLSSRCPLATAACRAEIPAARTFAAGHSVRCIRSEDLGKAEDVADTFDEFQAEAERILSVGAPLELSLHDDATRSTA
jgi:oligopeptide transport system ATP-binding protein